MLIVFSPLRYNHIFPQNTAIFGHTQLFILQVETKLSYKDQNTFELRTFLPAVSLQFSLSQNNNICFSASVRVSRCDIGI